MRILQLIDTLEVGGAERMAVNYVNALSKEIEFSGIVATRKLGFLKSRINNNVFFECLNKRFTLDLGSIFRLRSLCKQKQVDWIHAHGTSYFTAFLLKLIHPQIKIIWHEHAGSRSEKISIHNLALWILSRFFCGIIVVNQELENWCKTKLSFATVIYLPNFTVFNYNEMKETFLKGLPDKRIVCLANLRHPKNHKLMLEVAIRIKQSHPEWTFHLIGNDLKDSYSNELKAIIKEKNLDKTVYIYGMREDIDHIINQASIGVLTSSSEGLPVALLEYGLHKKAVVLTAVGQIPLIVKDNINGLLVPPNSSNLFYEKLVQLIDNEYLAAKLGKELNVTININHTEKAVIANYINWINNELKC